MIAPRREPASSEPRATLHRGPAGPVTGVRTERGGPALPSLGVCVRWLQPHEPGLGGDALDLAADARGNVFTCLRRDVIGRPPVARRVCVFPERAPRAFLSEVGLETVRGFLARALGLRDRFGQPREAVRFLSLETRTNGDLLFSVELAGLPHPAIVSYRSFDRRYELVAGPADIACLLGRDRNVPSIVVARPAASGDRIWLACGPRRAGDALASPSYPLRLAVLEREQRGPWNGHLLPAADFERAGLAPALALRGRPSPDGNWVFPAPGALWRLRPTGTLERIAAIPLPEHDVRVLPPVCGADGSIWLSVNRELASGTATPPLADPFAPDAAAPLWYRTGPASYWLRVAADGTRTEVLEAEALLATLRSAGYASRSGVLDTAALKPDPATGGVIGYDAHHRLLFALTAQPQDG